MGSSDVSTSESPGGSVWRIRPFLHYWIGGFVSSTGNWIQNVTASVLMYQLTGSSLMVGVLQFANFAPVFALSIVGGVLSDRFSRARIVTVTHLFSFTVAASLAALVLTDRITPILLIVCVGLIGSSHAISKPTLAALLPSLVPRAVLARASSLNVLQFNLGQVLGSTAATVLLATVGAGYAFVWNALTFFGPIVAMALIARRLAPQERSSKKGFAAAFEGLAYVRGNARMVAILVAIVLANGVMEGLRTLAPGLADGWAGPGPEAAGLLLGATSAGATASVFLFGLLQRRLSPRGLLALGFGLQMLGGIGVATAPGLTVAMVSGFPVGFGFALLIPLLNAGLQELSSDELRGRVMSAFSMAHLGLRPAWALIAGGTAVALNAPGAVAMLTVSALLGLRALRRIGAERRTDSGVIATSTP